MRHRHAAIVLAVIAFSSNAAVASEKHPVPTKRNVMSSQESMKDLERLSEKCKALGSDFRFEISSAERVVGGRKAVDFATKCRRVK